MRGGGINQAKRPLKLLYLLIILSLSVYSDPVHGEHSDILSRLEMGMGHCFHDRSLLIEALTHRSWANEKPGVRDNQRLEFFGDSVLGFLVSTLLFTSFPHATEGELTSMRASLVDEVRLAAIASGLEVGGCLYLGRGEEKYGGREKRSILADAYEALIAAVYLDGGIIAAKKTVKKHFSPLIEGIAVTRVKVADFKTLLQEYTQNRFTSMPTYELSGAEGPDHARIYTASVKVNGELCGRGVGTRKKEAEQAAAREALEFLKR